MKNIFCLHAPADPERLPALAEACLALSPQVAVGTESVFVETAASHRIFTTEECDARLREILALFGLPARMGAAEDPPTAQAFARYGIFARECLPVEALGDYLSPFAPAAFMPAALFRKLGLRTIGDFLRVPRAEIPSRFGREGLLAFERYLHAGATAWPRFRPAERVEEKVDLDFAAQIETLEPVLFLLKMVLDRALARLFARREKILEFDLVFRLNRFSALRERVSEVRLPLPHSDPAALLVLLRERLNAELSRRPLEAALEGLTLTVRATAPFLDAQRDLYSKAEAEREAWASLVARLRERLGGEAAFRAVPAPRLLPEASWQRSASAQAGTTVPAPARPLRLLAPPLPLRRKGDTLLSAAEPRRTWRIVAFRGPERLRAEWWLAPVAREYFRVETETDTLWVYSAEGALFLHGFFD